MEKEKILLDTDIGTDIDDAITLSYLLHQPHCELMGITIVTGEAEKRAKLASVLCHLAGRNDIPIHIGSEQCLFIEQKEKYAPQAAILDRWLHNDSFPRYEMIDFMRKTIRRYPGEVTLLGIAPLGNIALLFLTDPEIPSLLKRLVLMSGRFAQFDVPARRTDQRLINTAFVPETIDDFVENGALEMNALIDPYATRVVYQNPVAIHRSVGVDITRQVSMDMDTFYQKFNRPCHKPIIDMAGLWFRESGMVVFHDPLAALTVFDDAICHFRRGDVFVETEGRLKGYTSFTPNQEGKHEVAVDVDAKRFFEQYFSVF